MNGKQAAGLAATVWLFGGLLGVGFELTPPAHAGPPAITEDSDEWNCATMGNHICGPGNSTGLRPGRYDQEGLFIEAS